jgi:hypothetical protein
MKTFKRFITFKFMILTMLLAGTAMITESCSSNKPGCGTKRQKKARNKRVKSSTNFMTY